MRLVFSALALSACCLCAAQPAVAEETAKSDESAKDEEARPPDALDSVVLQSGELVRGVVRSSATGVTVRLPSGDEREITSAEIRRVNRWAAAPPRAVEPADVTVAAEVPTETRWYGQANIATDVLALALGVSGLAVSNLPGTRGATVGSAVALAGAGSYLFASPLIHAWHHHSLATSFGSFGLRLGAPVVLGIVGGLLALPGVSACEALPPDRQPELGCSLDEFGAVVLGAGLGILAAMIIDDAFLARETVALEAPRISLAPLLLPRGSTRAAQGGAGLSFAARF